MTDERLLRLPEVMARVGLKRSSIYAYIARNDFPEPIALGSHNVAWTKSSIDEWINVRIEAAQRARSLD